MSLSRSRGTDASRDLVVSRQAPTEHGLRRRAAPLSGRVVIRGLPQLGLHRRPAQLCHRVLGASARSRDPGPAVVARRRPRLRLRWRDDALLPAGAGYPACRRDETRRLGTRAHLHQGASQRTLREIRKLRVCKAANVRTYYYY